MIDARRQAYLEAMGLDVWVARPPAPEPGRLVFESGTGSTLLVCADASLRHSKLAGDIVRALGGQPAWAWPDCEGDPRAQDLAGAIDQELFTQLIVFGEDLAGEIFREDVPAVLGSAAVSVCPGLDELAVRGTAKKSLWQLLLRLTEGAAA